MKRYNLRVITRKLEELPTLPTIATLAFHKSMDSDVGAMELAAVVEKDQSLSAKLLRMANSSLLSTRIRNCPNNGECEGWVRRRRRYEGWLKHSCYFQHQLLIYFDYL